MTNREAIMQLTDEELAWFLVYEEKYSAKICFKFRGSSVEYASCEAAVEACKKWLSTELEEFSPSTKHADEDQFELSISAKERHKSALCRKSFEMFLQICWKKTLKYGWKLTDINEMSKTTMKTKGK